MAAAYGNTAEVVNFLLNEEADPTIRDSFGRTALMHAVKRNATDVLDVLIRGGSEINAQDNDGMTALMLAANVDNVCAIETLLKAGAKTDLKDSDGMTALMFAAFNGSEELIRLLLDAGRNVPGGEAVTRLQDSEGWTALVFAAQKNTPEAVKLLIDAEAQSGGPVLSEKKMEVLLIDAVRKARLNVDMRRDSLFKALMVAASNNKDPQVIKLLTGVGADVNARDAHNQTPLLLAVQRNCVEVVQAILDAGAEVDATRDDIFDDLEKRVHDEPGLHNALTSAGRGANGQTALIEAAEGNANPEILKALLNAGANVNAKNEYDQTALIFAAQDAPLNVVKLLLDAGADATKGDVLLHAATPEIVRALAKAGADVSVTTGDGKFYGPYTPVIAFLSWMEKCLLLLCL